MNDVRSLEDPGTCSAPKTKPVDPQAITRVRSGKIDQVWPRDSVIANNDHVVVARRTDARVHVEGPLGRGDVYLAPELGRCPGSELGRHIAGRNAPQGNGSYEFKRDTLGRGVAAQERLVVWVKNGAAVMRWQSGQLMVRALDEQIRDLGSVFTVVVDSAANRGIITVQEGVVTMRTGNVSAGQSFAFGAGQPRQSVTVRTAGLDEIRFHTDDVWRNTRSIASHVPRPSLRALSAVKAVPWRFIAGGTAAASAAGFVAYKLWGEKGPPSAPPVQAIVVIAIPF